jgi:hypothetical protein
MMPNSRVLARLLAPRLCIGGKKQTANAEAGGDCQGNDACNIPLVPDETRLQWYRIFASEDPAERTWSCEVEIERQTEEAGYEYSCGSNSSIEKRQQQSHDKQKGSDIFHAQQGTCEPSSAELRPFEIGSVSPYDDRAH